MNQSFQVMRELLQPAAVEVPEFDPDLGPAICKAGRSDECLEKPCRCDCDIYHCPALQVTIPQPGNYCFVLFQSAAVATRMISIFDETVACLKRALHPFDGWRLGYQRLA